MHTRDGAAIKIGDTIYLPCKVKAVGSSEEFCNVDVQSVYSMPPYEDSYVRLSAVNTRQFLSGDAVAETVESLKTNPA